MHPALNQTAPLCGITRVPGAVTATTITAAAVIVTRDHIIPKEVILTVDAAGVAPGGGPIPTTHHDHTHLDYTAIGHDPTKGINPTTGVGLNPQENAPVIDPVLQTANIPGVLRSPLTGSDVEQVGASIPSHKPITDQVVKIVCSWISCCCT